MSKKHKTKDQPAAAAKEEKLNFLELHWEKIVLCLLLVIPLLYMAQFLSPNRMIGTDYISERFPLEKWTSQQKQFPLWYPDILAGVPVFGSPIGIPLAPLTWLIYLIPPQVVLAIKFIVFFFVAGLGMYLYLKELGLSKYSAALGAFTYQFIGNLATTPYAGHAGRAASVAILPLLLYLVNRCLKTRKLAWFVGFSLAAALAFYEGQFQINYYGLLFILAYFICYMISRRKEFTAPERVKTIAYSLIAVAFIGLLMAVVWLPVLGGLKQAARGTERGFAWSASWAMPAPELIDLFVPSFSGILERYWGANAFKLHTEYFGLLAMILAFFAVVRFWKKPYVRFYAVALAFVALTALGSATPFFRLLYALVPGFTMFRAPSLVFYIASLSFIVLAAVGFDRVVVKKELDLKKFLATAGSFLALFALVVIIGLAIGRGLAGQKLNLYEENTGQFGQGILLGLILAGLTLALVYFGLKGRLRASVVAAALILLTLVSLIPLMAKFLVAYPGPDQYYAEDPVARLIKNDRSTFRVFPLSWGSHGRDNYLWYQGLQNCGGASPNPLMRFQEYTGAGTSVLFSPQNLIQYPVFCDMLNAKYFVGPALPDDISRYDENTQKIVRSWKRRYRPLGSSQEVTAYVNDSVLPRAYVVADYRICEAKDVMDILKSPQFDPRQTVVLEEDPGLPRAPAALPMSEARIEDYSANRVVCQTDDPVSGFLVLSENWHPDWRAWLDGKPVKIYRADYIFRSVYVPSGRHEVVFAFVSKGFNTGKIVTILSLIACLGLILGPKVLKKKSP